MTDTRADILIVDDRPENLVTLENMLANLGHHIVRASSGQEALRILLEQEFAVILLDVRMPEMDGFETAQWIRRGKLSRLTPIIFVTAGDDPLEKIAQGYSVGAVDYIQTPIPVGILKSKVKVFVDLFIRGKELARRAEALVRTNLDLEAAIGERKRTEEELRTAYKELEIFSYTVAHDLRAPLRAMSGFGYLLREEFSGKPFDQTGQGYALRIEEGAQKMDALIDHLLAYCHVARTKVELERVDPGPIIEGVLGRAMAKMGDRKLEIQVSESYPQVLGHRDLLGQVFSNLISNAVKFVAPGVRPRISIQHEPRQGGVRFWIADNGIGISPEHRSRIFKPFERLQEHATSSGIGMGLAVVRAAVERMAGRVGFESEPGNGSRFWIDLPSP